ncbi:MAG: hypothetical protein NZ602_09020 [Thermoguttaceae bacterium]|nr:hypothetical protein [Thermoguttaceae bacterium]MDW8037611.1 hypothetical protein [Thermoguttaceae bacterium]
MAWPSDQYSEEEYRRWLDAVAKAMGADSSEPEHSSASTQTEPASLLEFESAEEPPRDRFSDRGLNGHLSREDPPDRPPKKTTAVCSPRIWDLCKPYVLFVGIVLLGGLAAIGGLVWLTQWLIPPTRPPGSEVPIEAQWEVRRRGLHILPDIQNPLQNPACSAEQGPSGPSAREQPAEETP